jgi:YVTN family beta-propeller protein
LKPYALFTALLLSITTATPGYAGSYAYITNQGSNNVSVIDLEANRVTTTVPVGKSPVGVAVSAKLERVFVSNVDGQSVSVIDAKTNQVTAEISINGSPVGLALSPDNSKLYVADWFDDRILEIDTASLAHCVKSR